MKTIRVDGVMKFSYQWFDHAPKHFTLGETDLFESTISAVLIGDEGEVIDYFDTETSWETVQNMATDADIIYIWHGVWVEEQGRMIRSERDMYADCFGLTHETIVTSSITPIH